MPAAAIRNSTHIAVTSYTTIMTFSIMKLTKMALEQNYIKHVIQHNLYKCHYTECLVLFNVVCNVILLYVIMLNVIILNVVMLSVMALPMTAIRN
jgi:hypothetical protein